VGDSKTAAMKKDQTLFKLLSEILCKKKIQDFRMTYGSKKDHEYKTYTPSTQSDALCSLLCYELLEWVFGEAIAGGEKEISPSRASKLFSYTISNKERVEEYVSRDGMGIRLFEYEEKHIYEFIARSEEIIRLSANRRNTVIRDKMVTEEFQEKVWDSEDKFDPNDDGCKALCNRILSAIISIPNSKLGWLSEYVERVTSAEDTVKLLSALIIVGFSGTACDMESTVTVYGKKYLYCLIDPEEKEPDSLPPESPAGQGTRQSENPEPPVHETHTTHRMPHFSEILIEDIKNLASAENRKALTDTYKWLKQQAEAEFLAMLRAANDFQNPLRISEFASFADDTDLELRILIAQYGASNVPDDFLKKAKLAAFKSLVACIYVFVLDFLCGQMNNDEIVKEEDLTLIRQIEGKLKQELERAVRQSKQEYDKYDKYISALDKINNALPRTIVKE